MDLDFVGFEFDGRAVAEAKFERRSLSGGLRHDGLEAAPVGLDLLKLLLPDFPLVRIGFRLYEPPQVVGRLVILPAVLEDAGQMLQCRTAASGLGRIVGNPTSAQVIATGSYPLINGGSIRTPGSLVVSWDPTKPNNYGFDLENFGVPPDVWVKNSPQDDAKGMDKELKVAIDEGSTMIRIGSAIFGARS